MGLISGQQRGVSVDLKNCILFLKSYGIAGARPGMTTDLYYMALKFGQGNLSATQNIENTYQLDRGKLDDVRRGDEKPMSLSFEGKFTFFMSNLSDTLDETLTLHEFLDGKRYNNDAEHGRPALAGTREDWLAAFGCQPYCCDIEIHNNPGLDCPDTTAYGEATLMRYFRAESIAANFDQGTISVSGMAHILRPMIARCCVLGGTPPSEAGSGEFSYNDYRLAEPMDVATPGFWYADPRSLLWTP